MSEHENVAAWTAPGGDYPPYVSINERNGRVEITVRAPKSDSHTGPGMAVMAPMTHAEFSDFADQIARWKALRCV